MNIQADHILLLRARTLALGVALVVVLLVCTGCASSTSSTSGESSAVSPVHVMGTYEQADLSNYSCFQNSKPPVATYSSVTVLDVEKEMQDGSTFVLLTGFKDCPWCNALLPFLDEVAVQHNTPMLYLDTRANPSWTSNMDIDNYDTFVALFGDCLRIDGDGKKHLYVPHVFFVKDGTLIDDHSGTVPSQEKPEDELTQEQRNELVDILSKKFASLG